MKIKTNPHHLYTIFFGVIMTLGIYSCQVEPINSGENSVIETDSSAKQQAPATFDLSCITTATEVDLLAGQNILVGTVKVEVEGSDYKITYSITNSKYCITETHLSVATTPLGFPVNNPGNPQVGQFEENDKWECIAEVVYYAPIIDGPYIAAHAVVHCITDVTNDLYPNTLPAQVSLCVTDKGLDAIDSYFNIEIDPENSLTGAFDAWCADQDTSLESGDCFTADVYSSYETLPEGKFEHPENFGAVNWLMNQNFIGTDSGGYGLYTFGDLQIAIWMLIDDSICSECLYTGPYSPTRVDELVSMALEHTDCVPVCGEDVVIILIPEDEGVQSIFITIPVPCDCEETAWGDGCPFPGNQWATYFQYGLPE
ncbi:hypothetical protein [Mangrovimonas sp. TPBH4]|uniref:hypothetical protein n=1 Tax=Mangrovimonas sp. TPBH4 TaxID=1645914 RepID=UPI0006B551A9|nr:hypothetical protein [Mangrovimonas sp. TPBH4]